MFSFNSYDNQKNQHKTRQILSVNKKRNFYFRCQSKTDREKWSEVLEIACSQTKLINDVGRYGGSRFEVDYNENDGYDSDSTNSYKEVIPIIQQEDGLRELHADVGKAQQAIVPPLNPLFDSAKQTSESSPREGIYDNSEVGGGEVEALQVGGSFSSISVSVSPAPVGGKPDWAQTSQIGQHAPEFMSPKVFFTLPVPLSLLPSRFSFHGTKYPSTPQSLLLSFEASTALIIAKFIDFESVHLSMGENAKSMGSRSRYRHTIGIPPKCELALGLDRLHLLIGYTDSKSLEDIKLICSLDDCVAAEEDSNLTGIFRLRVRNQFEHLAGFHRFTAESHEFLVDSMLHKHASGGNPGNPGYTWWVFKCMNPRQQVHQWLDILHARKKLSLEAQVHDSVHGSPTTTERFKSHTQASTSPPHPIGRITGPIPPPSSNIQTPSNSIPPPPSSLLEVAKTTQQRAIAESPVIKSDNKEILSVIKDKISEHVALDIL